MKETLLRTLELSNPNQLHNSWILPKPNYCRPVLNKLSFKKATSWLPIINRLPIFFQYNTLDQKEVLQSILLKQLEPKSMGIMVISKLSIYCLQVQAFVLLVANPEWILGDECSLNGLSGFLFSSKMHY